HNSPPTITSNGAGATASVSVAENSTAVTTVVATDDGENTNTLTYSIVGGADAAKFTINASTGALSFIAAPNFEAPTDAGANNVYDVTVQASDGSLVDTQDIAVTVTNVNTAPTITSNGAGASATIGINENSTAVTTVTVSDDGENQPNTYSLSGADAGKFTISAGGVLSFVSAPDFENPTDTDHNNSYLVTVTANDGGLTDSQDITVNVGNVNTAPTITSNGAGATASVNVAENSTAVTTVVATDDGENSNTLAYSIVGGADAAKFAINVSTGALTFVAAPNFESPTDSGANNVYDVIVRASDGTLSDDQSIAVTVTDVAESGVITDIALGTGIVIPEWALLYTGGFASGDISGVSGAVGGTVTHTPGSGTLGTVTFTDTAPAG